MKHIRVIVTVLLLLVVWFGCGCMNAKKASNYMRNHPDVAAPICADLFPVKTVTDTKAFDSSIAVIDSLVELISQQQFLSDAQRTDLWKQIQMLQSDRPDCDSVMLPALDLIAKEKERAEQLESSNKKLQQAARNVKPIRDTVENTAKTRAYQLQLQACEDRYLKQTNDLSEMTHDRDDWRSKARGWKWKFWILLIIACVLIFRKQIFSLITKIPFMKSLILFLLASVLMLSGCATFKDDPDTSVWADGAWLVPWLTALGSVWFLFDTWRAWKSGSKKQTERGTLYSDKRVPFYKIAQFKIAVILIVATIAIIIYQVSQR